MVCYYDDGFLLCNGCASDISFAEGEETNIGKVESLRDNQTRCASCGLVVDPVTGNHIDELL
jgi:hypothetical protein